MTPDAVSLMGELARYYDEPFADSSAIPTYLVSRLASRSVKVVLSGDGGDEAFGGYSRYAHDLSEDRVRRLLPSWVRRTALARSRAPGREADWLPKPLRGKSSLTNVSRDAGSAYARTLSIADAGIRQSLMAPDRARRLDVAAPEAVIQAVYDAQPTGDTLAAMCATDIATTLPDDYLVKVDRASMAHGLEVRPPLLDHELIELAMRIPVALQGARRQGQVDLLGGLRPPPASDRPEPPEAGVRAAGRRVAEGPAAGHVRGVRPELQPRRSPAW